MKIETIEELKATIKSIEVSGEKIMRTDNPLQFRIEVASALINISSVFDTISSYLEEAFK